MASSPATSLSLWDRDEHLGNYDYDVTLDHHMHVSFSLGLLALVVSRSSASAQDREPREIFLSEIRVNTVQTTSRKDDPTLSFSYHFPKMSLCVAVRTP